MNKDYRSAVDVLFAAKRYGQKNQQGFWRWETDSKGKLQKVSDSETDDLLQSVCQPKRVFSDEDIVARMMIPMINEVVRCLDEGVIASPAEADMALVYGLGFPPFHGGAFRYLDTVSNDRYIARAEPFSALGPLYQVPASLREKATQGASWYSTATPPDETKLKTA